MTQITHLLPDRRFGLGEGPLWDDRTGHLYFVDIADRRVHRLDPESGAHRDWGFEEKISCLGLTESGGLLVSGQSGIWLMDTETGDRTLRFAIPALPDTMRTNDGKVGPDGAFWVGTMTDSDTRGPDGFVLRIAPDGTVQRLLEGLTTPNGMGWAKGGRRFLYAETRDRRVDQFDVGPDGALSNRRPFATFPAEHGRPDGASIDSAGQYWVAGIDKGRVNCLAPDGQMVGHVDLPTPMVTMPCFGGADLKTMFVTTLIRAGDTQPEAGGLYAFRVETPGLPAPRMPI